MARRLPGYRPRQAQQEMSEAVAAAIEARRCLIAEAGTGTGKTFAYLAPLILSGRRAVVSTGTKNLQDQLFCKDLPVIREALGVPFKAALLKGRGNYLCLYRLEHVLSFRMGHQRTETLAVEKIRRWARATATGDIAEVADVPESWPLWHAATSTVDNCLGQECPHFADCFLVQARRKALDAEIIVVNHHLVWADWVVKNEGFGELLPDPEVFVIDEAHQFPETAAQFLGLSISARQLNELAHDSVLEQIKDAPDQPELAMAAERLEHAVADFRLALGVGETRRETWTGVGQEAPVLERFEAMRQSLGTLIEGLKAAAVRGKGLESCWKRGEALEARLIGFVESPGTECVRWFETHKRGFALHHTPLEIAGEFAKFRRESQATWIFTSATLSVSGRFDHFVASLRLTDTGMGGWESPFDYANQSLLYLPEGLPEPSAPDYTAAVVNAAVPVLKASRGRAFLLFTSHQALQTAATLLPARIEYPLFVQGSQPKAVLLEAFRRAGNGVLLGTSSFWEGVDVRGPALSCVIIDKLPFASPSDPVLGARLETLKRRGSSPFAACQLPSAVIALKQGVGRLIRSSEDRGVLMLCDPRLLSKSYGKVFLDSLPPMRRTRLLRRVEEFFRVERGEGSVLD